MTRKDFLPMRSSFKFWIVAFLFVFVPLTACPVFAADKAEPTKADSAYAAMVNGTKILKQDLDRKVDLIQARYASMGKTLDPAKLDELRSKLLENMIDEELLFQASQKAGITVDAAKVQEELNKIRNKFPTKKEFEARMKDMGYTEAILKHQIEQNMAIQALIDKEIMAKIKITDAAAQAYYKAHASEFKQPEEIRARHILIKVASDASSAEKAAAKKKIEEIQKKLKKGADFAELAKAYSEGPSAKKGGDLGFFSRGQMVEPFEKAAFALKKIGDVSDIVQTPFGYHLIKLEARKPAGVTSFKDAKEYIVQKLKHEQAMKQISPFIDGLKAKAKIEMNLPKTDQKPKSK